MSQDVMTTMLTTIRESIARVQSSAGQEPDRAITRVLAHLWSAHDELEMHHRDAQRAAR